MDGLNRLNGCDVMQWGCWSLFLWLLAHLKFKPTVFFGVSTFVSFRFVFSFFLFNFQLLDLEIIHCFFSDNKTLFPIFEYLIVALLFSCFVYDSLIFPVPKTNETTELISSFANSKSGIWHGIYVHGKLIAVENDSIDSIFKWICSTDVCVNCVQPANGVCAMTAFYAKYIEINQRLLSSIEFMEYDCLCIGHVPIIHIHIQYTHYDESVSVQIRHNQCCIQCDYRLSNDRYTYATPTTLQRAISKCA